VVRFGVLQAEGPVRRESGLVIGMRLLAHAAAAQFIQQGGKLTGEGAVGSAEQGWTVAIAADGATAIIGGCVDNSYACVGWVYTRSGGVWSPLPRWLTTSQAIRPPSPCSGRGN
jgi:hypothetical protein